MDDRSRNVGVTRPCKRLWRRANLGLGRGGASFPVVDSTDSATAVPPTPFKNCPRVRCSRPAVAAMGPAGLPSVSLTSPSDCITRQVSAGPRKRPRLAPSRQLVHARATVCWSWPFLTSKRVGVRGVFASRVFLRHSSTRGSRSLRTSSLPDSWSEIRQANPPHAEHPPS